MTQTRDQAGTPAGAEQAGGLDVRIARQLLEQARADGVCLAGRAGCWPG